MINLQLTMEEVNLLLEGLGSKINESNLLRMKVYQVAQAQINEQEKKEKKEKELEKEEGESNE